MWVRNQKKCLITDGTSTYYIGNVDWDTPIYKYRILFSNGATTNENNSLVMAAYSTKAKAMKVMDMLEEHISNVNTDTWSGAVFNNTIFQFPKDEEVTLDETEDNT